MVEVLERIFFPRRVRERRRIERWRVGLERHLETYAGEIAVIEDTRSLREKVRGRVDLNASLDPRAAKLLSRVRGAHAEFRRACDAVDATRARVDEHLADPAAPTDVVASARRRFQDLQARHPVASAMRARDAEWCRQIAQLEHWARGARLQGANQRRDHRGEVIYDRGDRLHVGWWHGP